MLQLRARNPPATPTELNVWTLQVAGFTHFKSIYEGPIEARTHTPFLGLVVS